MLYFEDLIYQKNVKYLINFYVDFMLKEYLDYT